LRLTEARRLPYVDYLTGIALVLMTVGLVLIVIGTLASGGDVSASGILLIGPIPIVFGHGTLGQVLALLATLMTIFLLALFVYFTRRRTSLSGT